MEINILNKSQHLKAPNEEKASRTVSSSKDIQ